MAVACFAGILEARLGWRSRLDPCERVSLPGETILPKVCPGLGHRATGHRRMQSVLETETSHEPRRMRKTILVVNPGSTSTRVALVRRMTKKGRRATLPAPDWIPAP